MNYPRVASRYSKALLELAVEHNELDKVSADVVLLKSTINGSEDFALLLKSPVVKADKKQAVLKAVFKGAFSPLFERFVALLVKNHRENVLIGICEKFESDVLEYKGIMEAEVTTAVALTEADKAKLVATLKAQIGKDIKLDEIVDPSTIGGMKLKVGGYQLDNTISGKLRAMKNELIDATYESKL
jgi:F-type H+-transporting ATPase subunit delta